MKSLQKHLRPLFTVLMIAFLLIYQSPKHSFTTTSPVHAQDEAPAVTLTAIERALMTYCYGPEVALDIEDPTASTIDFEKAGLTEDEWTELSGFLAEAPDYESQLAILVDYCLDDGAYELLVTNVSDETTLQEWVINYEIVWEDYYLLVEEYVYYEIYFFEYMADFGIEITEEMYAEFLYVFEYGTEESIFATFEAYGIEDEELIAQFNEEISDLDYEVDTSIEEGDYDSDDDGEADIYDEDDDNDGEVDSEDVDDDGDGADDDTEEADYEESQDEGDAGDEDSGDDTSEDDTSEDDTSDDSAE